MYALTVVVVTYSTIPTIIILLYSTSLPKRSSATGDSSWTNILHTVERLD